MIVGLTPFDITTFCSVALAGVVCGWLRLVDYPSTAKQTVWVEALAGPSHPQIVFNSFWYVVGRGKPPLCFCSWLWLLHKSRCNAKTRGVLKKANWGVWLIGGLIVSCCTSDQTQREWITSSSWKDALNGDIGTSVMGAVLKKLFVIKWLCQKSKMSG
jgi:hypothetical protein